MDIDLKCLPGCLLPTTAKQNHLVNWYLLQNIYKGCQQSLGFVLNAMFVTEAFHQGSHFPVVVPRHCGEQAAEWGGRVVARLGFLPAQNTPLPQILPMFFPRMILTGAQFGSSGAQWTSHWTETGSRCRLRGAGREKKPQTPKWFRFYFPASPTIESPAITAHPYLA